MAAAEDFKFPFKPKRPCCPGSCVQSIFDDTDTHVRRDAGHFHGSFHPNMSHFMSRKEFDTTFDAMNNAISEANSNFTDMDMHLVCLGQWCGLCTAGLSCVGMYMLHVKHKEAHVALLGRVDAIASEANAALRERHGEAVEWTVMRYPKTNWLGFKGCGTYCCGPDNAPVICDVVLRQAATIRGPPQHSPMGGAVRTADDTTPLLGAKKSFCGSCGARLEDRPFCSSCGAQT